MIMRLAEGIRSNINQFQRVVSFLGYFTKNEHYDEDWSAEIEALECEIEKMKRELEDAVNGDFWIRGPISEIKVASEKKWL